MAKLSVKKKGDQILVKRKLGWNEEISEREVMVFRSKLIRGLVRPNVDGNKITYTVPGNMTLREYLKTGIDKKAFFVIIAQIIEITKKIEKYGLNINNLVLNLQYVYVNKMTKELHFIYQPVTNKEVSISIYAFVNDVAYESVFSLEEDTDFINDFMKFLQNMERYSATEIEAYILKNHSNTYKIVKKEQPKSTVLQSKAWERRTAAYVSTDLNDIETELLEEEEDIATGLLEEDDDIPTGPLKEEEDIATGLLEEDDDPMTELLCETPPRYPYLLRLSTYEQVEINKPVFRIGKERSYVDYFVANNNAVSRLHADIIVQNNIYYIKDNNSTNRTYINGTAINAGQNVMINEGDQIMLANETFEFHW